MGVGTWREAPPRAGASSPGLPSPRSEASCLSYTEKVGFRVTGQRSHSHEGVGQGLNPLGILAPPQSERRVREEGARAMAAPGEPHPPALCVQRFSVSHDVREEERARSVAVLCLCGQSRALAEGSRLHGLALKETVGATPVSAGWFLSPASLAHSGRRRARPWLPALPALLCDLRQFPPPASVLPTRWVTGCGLLGC